MLLRTPPAAAVLLLLLCCAAITATHAALADDWTPQSAGLSHAYTAAAPAWSDEFAAGPSSGGVSVVTQPDQTKWSKITGPPKFNGEMQTYVDDAAHSAVSSGKLHLVATRDAPASLGSGFQSTKLSTAGQVSFHYGLFAVRARLPRGRGLWPSIWLFGDAAGEAAKYEEISIAELGAGGNDGRAASVAWFSKGDKQSVVRAGVPAALSVEPAAFADDFHGQPLALTHNAGGARRAEHNSSCRLFVLLSCSVLAGMDSSCSDGGSRRRGSSARV